MNKLTCKTPGVSLLPHWTHALPTYNSVCIQHYINMHWSQWHAESFECPITVDRYGYKPLSLWVWIQNKWAYSRARTERRGSRIPIHFLFTTAHPALSDPQIQHGTGFSICWWSSWPGQGHIWPLWVEGLSYNAGQTGRMPAGNSHSRGDTRSCISSILSWPPHWFPLATQRILFPLKWGFRLTLQRLDLIVSFFI